MMSEIEVTAHGTAEPRQTSQIYDSPPTTYQVNSGPPPGAHVQGHPPNGHLQGSTSPGPHVQGAPPSSYPQGYTGPPPGAHVQGHPPVGYPVQVYPPQQQGYVQAGPPSHTYSQGVDNQVYQNTHPKNDVNNGFNPAGTVTPRQPSQQMPTIPDWLKKEFSLQVILRIIKLVCWFVMLIIASVGVSKFSLPRYTTVFVLPYTNQSTMNFMLALSLIFLVADGAVLILHFTGHLTQMFNKSQRFANLGMMGYNAAVIFLYYVSNRVSQWAPPVIAADDSGTNVMIAYEVFAGIGVAACVVDLNIYHGLYKQVCKPATVEVEPTVLKVSNRAIEEHSD